MRVNQHVYSEESKRGIKHWDFKYKYLKLLLLFFGDW